jgi:Xaa-Pro aminopeptidase
VPYGDYVPAGTLELVRSTGAIPVSSGELVTRYCSVWSPEDLASHLRAASKVADIARAGIALMGERSRSRSPLTEHDLTRWTLEAIDRVGLVTESAPSVSYGEHAARAHYEAGPEGSSPLVPGALVLYDLWAKEKGGVYADQTWMASLGPPGEQAEKLWTIVMGARDAAINLLQERLASRQPVAGAEADRAARQVIVDAGYGDRIICRTGHSIDRMGIHGFGPTIDDTESFDTRQILPGAGFSIEPGIYIPGQIGLRSEVNGYAKENGLGVTPDGYQTALIVV